MILKTLLEQGGELCWCPLNIVSTWRIPSKQDITYGSLQQNDHNCMDTMGNMAGGTIGLYFCHNTGGNQVITSHDTLAFVRSCWEVSFSMRTRSTVFAGILGDYWFNVSDVMPSVSRHCISTAVHNDCAYKLPKLLLNLVGEIRGRLIATWVKGFGPGKYYRILHAIYRRSTALSGNKYVFDEFSVDEEFDSLMLMFF